MRIFRHILTAVVAGQGTANTFTVKDTDYDAVIASLRADFKAIRDMKSKIYSLAEAYLTAYGAETCRTTTDDKYWKQIKKNLNTHFASIC